MSTSGRQCPHVARGSVVCDLPVSTGTRNRFSPLDDSDEIGATDDEYGMRCLPQTGMEISCREKPAPQAARAKKKKAGKVPLSQVLVIDGLPEVASTRIERATGRLGSPSCSMRDTDLEQTRRRPVSVRGVRHLLPGQAGFLRNSLFVRATVCSEKQATESKPELQPRQRDAARVQSSQ